MQRGVNKWGTPCSAPACQRECSRLYPTLNLSRAAEVDWDYWLGKLKEWGPLVAGALFGLGWWCWVDAVVYQKAVAGEGE